MTRALVAAALLLIALPARAGGPSVAPLTTIDFDVVGTELRVTEPVFLPKSIPGAVEVRLVAGDDPADDATVAALTDGAHLEATLRGPGMPSFRVVGPADEPLALPPLHVAGEYRLDDIRLVDTATGGTRLEASPASVAVQVFPEVLVAQVTSRPLSRDEIAAKGITIDENNFAVTEFELVFALEGQSFPVRFPVVAPSFPPSTEIVPQAELEDALVQAQLLNEQLGRAVTLPPELTTPGLGIHVAGTLFQMVMPEDEAEIGSSLPSLPGLVVIPGDIAFLNQFFSVQVYVANAAPLGSGLSLHDISAKATLPTGRDHLPAASYSEPGDDPLRFARVGGVTSDATAIANVGPDARPGTSDDRPRLFPGESGQGELLVEGLREGLHLIDIDLYATLDGMAGREVPIHGKAAGSILVRNPKFSLTFSHPRTIRSGEPYTARATILNTSSTTANLVSVSLAQAAISGAELTSAATIDLGDIAPGEAASAEWTLVARRTGSIAFANLEGDDGLSGAFAFTMGVDERGVALSPAAIGYPDEVAFLPPAIRDAADRVLGQALGVATAAQLPAGVHRTTTATITARVVALAQAGQRLQYGDSLARVLPDLWLDWIGDPAFDEIIATTNAGRALREAFGAAIDADLATLAARAADLAGRHETWDLLASDDLAITPTLPIPGSSGAWGIGTDFVADTHGATHLSHLTLAADGTGTLDAFTVPAAAAGCYRLDGAALIADLGCDGTTDATLTSTRTSIIEAAPTIIRVRQATEVATGRPDPACPPPPYRNYGTVVAVMFSKPLDASAQDLAHYALDSGFGANGVALQPGGRVALVNVAMPIGTLRPRSLVVTQVRDRGGHALTTTVPIEATADLGVALTGRVLDQAGSPAAGIPVTLTMYDAKATPLGCGPVSRRLAQVMTDARGEFAFDYVMAGVGYSVSATNTRGLSADAVAALLASADPTGTAAAAGLDRAVVQDGVDVTSPRVGSTVPLLLRFRGRGAVIGHVVDATGRARSGVAVNLYPDPDSRELGRGMFSDQDGGFAFDGVPLGNYNVTAQTSDGLSRTVAGVLGQVGATDDLTIELAGAATPTGRLRGKVVRADGLTPDPGATVGVIVGRAAIAVVTADADGLFAADDLPVGTYEVLAIAFAGNVSGRRAPVTISAGDETWTEVVLQGTGTVHGVVRFADGRPAGFALVAGGDALVTADASGLFTLTGVPTGARTIEAGIAANPALHIDFARLGSAGIDVVPGDANGVVVTLAAAGRIEGRVRDPDGHPVPNVVVAMPGTGGFRYVRADALGVYRFDNVPLGKYLVSAPAPAVDKTPAKVDAIIAELQAASDVGEIAAAMDEAAELYAGASSIPDGAAPDGSWGYARTSIAFDGQTRTQDIQLLRRGDVSGVVLNDRGTPIGAVVTLSGTTPGDNGGPTTKVIGQTRSDPALGTFAFAAATLPGAYSLAAVSPFYPTAAGATGTLAPSGNGTEDANDVTLRFDPKPADAKARLTGVVLNPDGSPAGADVEVIITRSPLYSVRTIDGGRFDNHLDVAPGAYRLETIAPGASGFVGADDVVASAGVNDFTLHLRGFAPGIAVVVRDSGGAVVAGANVSIDQITYPETDDRSAATDASGAASFAGVREGVFVVKACKVVGPTQLCANDQISVAASDPAPRVVALTLAGTGAIHGFFYAADQQTPIAAAQIAVDRIGFTQTDGDGEFDLLSVPEGDYRVTGTDAVTGRRAQADAHVVVGKTAELRLVESALGVVRGVVIGPDGVSPVPAATIDASDADPLTPNISVTTDASGRFEVRGLAYGPVSVGASDRVSGLGGSATATLDADHPEADVEVRLPLLGAIAGTVYEADGAPAALATVVVAGQTKQTSPDGRVTFSGLGLGSYVVTATSGDPAQTHSIGTAAITIDGAGAAPDFEVHLSGVGTISGTVRAANDTAVPGAIVRLTAGIDADSVLADALGAFAFEDVPVGDFTVTADDGTSGGGATGTAIGGEVTDVVVHLGATGTITGRVVREASTTPVAGAVVVVHFAPASIGADGVRVTASDATGGFTFDAIPQGAVDVELSKASLDGVQRVSGVLGATLDLGDVHLDERYPSVVSVTPANGSSGIAIGAAITVTFSEPIDPASLSNAGVRLQGATLIDVAVAQPSPDTITVTPTTSLASGTTYTLTIVGGLFQTVTGDFIGPLDRVGRPLLASFSASFSTGDGTPPALVTLTPAPGATEVDPSAVVRAVFSEPIDITAATFTLTGSGAIASRVDAGLDGLSIVLTPLHPLPLNATFTATLSGIRDRAGNAAANEPFTTTFATLDTIGPAIATAGMTGSLRTNAAITIDVALATPEPGVHLRASLDFAAPIATAPGVLSFPLTLPAVGGHKVLRITATDAHGNDGPLFELGLDVVANAPPTVTLERITPATGPARSGALFSIRCVGHDDGAIASVSGSLSGALTASGSGSPLVLSGVVPASTGGANPSITARCTATDDSGATSEEATSTITVADGVAPSLTVTGLANNQSVAPGTVLTVHASATDAFGVAAIDLAVSGAFTDTQTFAGPSTSLTHDFTVNVPANATAGAAFHIAVAAHDDATNTATRNFDITVADVVPPHVALTSPAANATAVAITTTIDITFDEPVQTSGTITFAPAFTLSRPDAKTIRLTPDVALANGTPYTITISGVTDLANNALAAPYTFSFTTAAVDLAGPTLIAVTPADQATKIPLDPTITAAFDEPILAASVDGDELTLRDPSDHIVAATVTLDTPTTVTLTPTAPLRPSATYTITLDGLLTDADGNPANGPAGPLTSHPVTSSFTTFRIDIVVPADGDRAVESQRIPAEVDADDAPGLYAVTFSWQGTPLASAYAAPFVADVTPPTRAAAGPTFTLDATVAGTHLPGAIALDPVVVTILAALDDEDGDGIGNGVEIALGLDPLRDDASEDPDADGLDNLGEVLAGTDPHDPDSDDDGDLDGVDLEPLNGNRPPVAGIPAAGDAGVFDGSTSFALPASVRAQLPLAVEAWAAPTSGYLYRSDPQSGVAIDYDGTRFRFLARTAAGPIIAPASITSDGGWHHVAWTADGTRLRGYVDAKLVADVALAGALLYAPGTSAFGDSYVGQLDEARVWTVVRSAAATALDAMRKIDDAPGLLVVEHFDQTGTPSGAIVRAPPSFTLATVAEPVTIDGYDLDGDALTAMLTALPHEGELRIGGPAGPRLTAPGPITSALYYVARPGFFGDDRFAYAVSDGHTTSEPADVVVTIPPGKTWIGGVSNDWDVAANWSPSGVPTDTDDVVIPAGAAPVIAAGAATRTLVVAPGATLAASGLVVSGHLAADGPISGDVVMNLDGATARGRVEDLTIAATVAPDGPLTVTDLHVTGSLVMSDDSVITVTRDADFGEECTISVLDAGTIRIGGDFTQHDARCGYGNTFAAGGTHTVILDGTAPQTIAFASPKFSHFHDLVIDNPAGVVFATDVEVRGDLVVARPTTLTGARVTVGGDFAIPAGTTAALDALTVSGDFTLAAGASLTLDTLDVGGDATIAAPLALDAFSVGGAMAIADAGTFSAATTTFTGTTPVQPDVAYQDVVVSGSATLTGTTSFSGDLTIEGTFDVAASALDVAGDLVVEGTLVMGDDAGRLAIAGDATFGGGNCVVSALSAGTLRVAGDFAQHPARCGFPNTFFATGTHRVVLDGAAPQSVAFDKPMDSAFNDLAIDNPSVTFTTDVKGRGDLVLAVPATISGAALTVGGDLTLPAGSSATLTALAVGGDFTLASGAVLATSTLSVGGAITTHAPLALDAFSIGGAMAIDAATFSATTTTFIGTTAMQPDVAYQDVVVAANATLSGTTAISGDLTVDGAFDAAAFAVTIGGDLTVHGALSETDAAASVSVAGDATFGGACVVSTLTAGALAIGGDLAQHQAGCGFPNTFVAAAAHTTTLDGAAPQTVTFDYPGASGFGALVIDNAAVTFATKVFAYGDVVLARPTTITGSDLTISGDFAESAGTSATLSALAVGGDYTLPAGATLDATSLSVTGAATIQAPLVLDAFAIGGAMSVDAATFTATTVTFSGATDVQPDVAYVDVVVSGAATLTGSTVVSGDARIAGDLYVGAETLTIGGALTVTGTLHMTDDAALVSVVGDASFGIGCAHSELGAGALHLGGALVQRRAECGYLNTFASVGTRVVLDGGATQTLDFEYPDYSGFADLVVAAGSHATLVTPIVAASIDLAGQLDVPAALSCSVSGALTLEATAHLTNDGTTTVGACVKHAGYLISGTDPCP